MLDRIDNLYRAISNSVEVRDDAIVSAIEAGWDVAPSEIAAILEADEYLEEALELFDEFADADDEDDDDEGPEGEDLEVAGFDMFEDEPDLFDWIADRAVLHVSFDPSLDIPGYQIRERP